MEGGLRRQGTFWGRQGASQERNKEEMLPRCRQPCQQRCFPFPWPTTEASAISMGLLGLSGNLESPSKAARLGKGV